MMRYDFRNWIVAVYRAVVAPGMGGAMGAVNTASAASVVSAAGAFLLWGCAAAPVNFQCREIQMRLSYENLSEDQRRFAEEELASCERDLEQARLADSTRVLSLERRLDPGKSSATDDSVGDAGTWKSIDSASADSLVSVDSARGDRDSSGDAYFNNRDDNDKKGSDGDALHRERSRP